jgi:hypothetical protein
MSSPSAPPLTLPRSSAVTRVRPQPLVVVSDERARAHGAEIVRDVHVNPNAKQQELWLRDPDGYTVVLAGPSEHRPR